MLGARCVVVPLASIGKPEALAEHESHECDFLSCSRQGKGIHESVFLYTCIYAIPLVVSLQPQNGKQRLPAMDGLSYMCCIPSLHHFARYQYQYY